MKIDCNYIALQFESYHKSKNKYYDTSLKMIGSDCKQLELNIDKFISTFLGPNQKIEDKSCEVFRNIITLYRLFKDVAYDIRSIMYDKDRVCTFQCRVDKYFETFKKHSRGSAIGGKPYMHILREHIAKWMLFWGEHMHWGYGYFNCNGGEHLNKRIKCMEFGETNMKEDRFCIIVRNLRVKQLHRVSNQIATKWGGVSKICPPSP